MKNLFPFPEAAKDALLNYFLDQLEDSMASAGSNDMDQSVFDGLAAEDKMDLYTGFLKYDEQANPDGWEPRKFNSIPDFSWLGYLRSRLKEG